MFVPMWLVVLLVLFGALGVWALIFFMGFIFRMIDTTLKVSAKKNNDGNPTV